MPGIIFAMFISIGIPIFLFIYACVRKRYIPFFLGVLAFLVSQVFIRIPILEYLQEHSTEYLMFRATQPVLYAILLALTAGIFEEIARFIMIRFFMKQRDWQSGFLFGAGHGGIEALLFVGINAFAMLFSLTANVYTAEFFLGGIERIFAMLLHIGLSIIVLQGVIQRKFLYVVLAILIHGSLNALVGILPLFMSPNSAVITVQLSIAIIALAVFSYSLKIKRKER
ncbi:YhfC family glutamic-type intramembrane protease [Virgibacillus kimchii]